MQNNKVSPNRLDNNKIERKKYSRPQIKEIGKVNNITQGGNVSLQFDNGSFFSGS